ncbi:MAG: IS630 family transposase, partial [Acidobacteria bacterium]|nr:IS630 family transposase [Acidobacteriota bacterium]
MEAIAIRGEPVGLVARVMKVPMRTLFGWLARYRSGGWHALREGKRSGRPRKVSGEVMAWLYQAITMGSPQQYKFPFCLWTLNIVRQMLKQERGISLSKSAVCRLLQHLGLTPQRPIYRSYKQDPRELEQYLRQTFPELKRLAQRLGAELYFVDESAVRSDSHRGTTWGPIGQTPVVPDSGERFGMKLISAVSPRGDMRFGVIAGRMNSDRFIEFLKKLCTDAGKPIIVIADNAPYHGSKKVRRFVQQNQPLITLAHLPRYAPELNPDEQVWNHAKARLAKLFVVSPESLQRYLLNILQSIQKRTDLILSFFQLESTRYAA